MFIMDNTFSLSSSSAILYGDYFSVFDDGYASYWVVSNDFPTIFQGPFDKKTAFKIMSSSNEYFNSLKLKGLFF